MINSSKPCEGKGLKAPSLRLSWPSTIRKYSNTGSSFFYGLRPEYIQIILDSTRQYQADCYRLPHITAYCRTLPQIAQDWVGFPPLFTHPSIQTLRQLVFKNFSNALLGLDLVIVSTGLSQLLIQRISSSFLRLYNQRRAIILIIRRFFLVVPSLTRHSQSE